MSVHLTPRLPLCPPSFGSRAFMSDPTGACLTCSPPQPPSSLQMLDILANIAIRAGDYRVAMQVGHQLPLDRQCAEMLHQLEPAGG